MFKLYFGGDTWYLSGVFGLPPTRPDFEAHLTILEGCPLPLPLPEAVMGGDVAETSIARMALERGGHLHVGLDYWNGAGDPSNEEIVTAAALCAESGRPVARHEYAVRLLGIAGPLP